MTTKVALRQKPISKGRKSLYLDFYPPIIHSKTGKPTRREFLGLYVCEKPRNILDRQHNKEILELAECIRQKWDNRLNKPEIYSDYEKKQLRIKELGEQSFIDYFQMLGNKRKSSTHDNWTSALNYLERYTGGTLKFSELNEKFCNDFKEYLLSTRSAKSNKMTLSQNSALSYFNKLKAALKQAYKDGYLQYDLNSKIEPIKEAETQRNFLTIEELNKLVKTKCADSKLKQAALFSALTGMAFKEIQNLRWSDIEYSKDYGYYIPHRRQKTGRHNYLPISEQAYSLLGERKEAASKIFEGLKEAGYHTKDLRQWILSAGINKAISFHCFRHTFATLQLTKGTDIYTVSKMLGHKNLQTTQVYAKIVDEVKRKAAEKIKLEL